MGVLSSSIGSIILSKTGRLSVLVNSIIDFVFLVASTFFFGFDSGAELPKRILLFSTASVKRYLQVTDKQFSEAAGVAQGVAPAQVIGNQGISENSPTLKKQSISPHRPIMSCHKKCLSVR